MTHSWFRRYWNNLFSARRARRGVPLSTRTRGCRLRVEQLEDRVVPASTITILATGTGSLDAIFEANNGLISITNGTNNGTQAETLSAGALATIPANDSISITARTSISFNSLLSQLTLKTGLGSSDTFAVASGTGTTISFANTANTLASSGGSLVFNGGTNLTLANLNANGGNLNLTSALNAAGNINAQALLTSGNGNITLQATNASGGTITQTGQFQGQQITATATGNISVDSVRGTTVTFTSNNGSISSAGANPIQSSAQLSLTAATGIIVRSLAASLQATNSTSGSISVTQLATATQALTTGGSGVVNQAPSGSITISNLGSTLTVAAGAPISSSNGAITLLATDFTLLNTINSGTAITTLGNSVAGTPINVGTDNVFGSISLSQAELDEVTASTLQIGTPTAGAISISNAVTTANAPGNIQGTLALFNNSTILETFSPNTGSLTATDLRVSSTGPVSFSNVNNVANLAASTTNSFFINNGTNTLTIPNAGVDGIAGVVTNGANITLVADNIVIHQVVSPGPSADTTDTVVLEPFTTTLNMTIASPAPGGTFNLTDAELGWITSGITEIGSNSDTGTIAINQAVTRTPTSTAPTRSQALFLVTNNAAINPNVSSTTGAITQTAALSVANLATQTVGGVQLTNGGNDVDTVAGAVTGSAAFDDNYRLNDSPTVAGTTLTVGVVAGISGITTPFNDFLELTTTAALTLTDGLATGGTGLDAGGAVTQGSGAAAAISTQALELLGTGPYTLTNPNNSATDGLAASVTDAVSYANAGALGVTNFNYPDGFGGAVVGVSTSNAPISINTVDGGLLVESGSPVNAGSSTVSLTAGSNNDNQLLSIDAAVSGTSGVTLTGDNITIAAAVNAGSATAVLQPFSSGQTISLGTANSSNTFPLGLSSAEINDVTAGIIVVGNSTAGTLTVTAQIDPANSNQLELITGADIESTSSTDPALTVDSLGLEAVSGIGIVTNEEITMTVNNVAAETSFGGIDIEDGFSTLTVGGVTGLSFGVEDTGSTGDVFLENVNGSINVTTSGANVNGPANVSVVAMGFTSNVQTGGNQEAIENFGAGTVTVDAGQDILAGFSGGAYGDIDANIAGNSSAANLVLDAGRDIILQGLGASFADANNGGSLTATAGRNITVAPDGHTSKFFTGSGPIVLTTGAGDTFTLDSPGLVISNNSGTGGPITINTDHAIINGTIRAGTGIVTIQPVTTSENIQLGTTTDNELDLSNAELANISGGILRIGAAIDIGNINVTAAVSVPNVPTLSLRNGGSISDNSSTDTITVKNLAAQASTGINLDTVGVAELAFDNINSGAVYISNTSNSTNPSLTVTSVDQLTPSSNDGASSTTTTLIETGGPLIFAVSVTSTGDLSATTVESSPDGTLEETLTVDAGVTVRSTSGNLSLLAADGISLDVGSTEEADTGSITLNAGFNDTDSDSTGFTPLGGTLNSGNGIFITSPGNIFLTTPISAPGQTVTIVSTSGGIYDDNDISDSSFVINITANALGLEAATGIGVTNASNPTIDAAQAPLETQVNHFEAETTTGNISIDNGFTTPTTLDIDDTAGLGLPGVRITGASGNISLVNAGSINVVTHGENVQGPANVTVTANGSTSNIQTGGFQEAIQNLGAGNVMLTAGQDIILGLFSSYGDVNANTQGNSAVANAILNAGRDIILQGVDASVLDAGNGGSVTATAGRNISVALDGNGSAISTVSGAINLTTGAGGTFSLDESGTVSSDPVASGAPITIKADHAVINGPIDAGTSTVTIEQVTSSVAINLGATTDAELDLSNAEINEITASVLRIGALANTGSITVSAPIDDTTTFATLDLLTGGSITEAATPAPPGPGTLTVTNLALQAAGAVAAAQANGVVSTLAGSVTGSGNGFTFINANSLGVGIVDSVSGIVTNNGPILIDVTGTLTNDGTHTSDGIVSGTSTITLNANAFVNSGANGGANVQASGSSGNVTIHADNIDIQTNSSISSNARIILAELTAGTPINLGGADVAPPNPVLGISANDLSGVFDTAGVVQIGDQNAGPMTISAALEPEFIDTFDLESGSTITETAGTLTIANLAIRAVGSVSLTNTNDISGSAPGGLAAKVTGAGNTFTLVDADTTQLIIGSVDSLNGVNTNNGLISVAATFSGAAGASTPDLTVDQNSSAGSANFDLTALGADSFITLNGAAIAGAVVDLEANRMSLSGGIGIDGGSRVILQASTPLRPINLGLTIKPTGALDLSSADLNTVDAPVLQIGNGTEGNVTIGAGNSISLSSFEPTLTIFTAGAVLGSGSITVSNLRISDANGANLTGANDVGNLAAAVSTASQAFVFNDTTSETLDIATVDNVSGVSTNNGAITISNTVGMAVVNNVAAGDAPVALTVDQAGQSFQIMNAIITGDSATITADSMTLGAQPTESIVVGTGPSNIVQLEPFSAGLAVSLDASVVSGHLSLTQTELNTITAGVVRVGSATAGNLTVNTPITAAGTSALSFISGGSIGQGASDLVTATSLALQGVGVNLPDSNVIVTLAGNGGNRDFSVVDDHDLTVGTVDSVNGITDGNASAINLTVENPELSANDPGLLTVSSPITDNAIGIGGGTVNLIADNMAFTAAITVPTGLVTVNPFDGVTVISSINLGTADGGNNTTLQLDNSDLNEVTTGVLRIGTASGAPIVISGNIGSTPTPYTTLSLLSGSGVSETGGSRVTGTNLSIDTTSIGASTSVPFLIDESSIAAIATTGSIFLSNDDPNGLTISSANWDGVTGLTANTPSAVISVVATTGSLTVAGNTTANGAVTLTTSGGISNNIKVDAGVTVKSTTGNITLSSAGIFSIPPGSLQTPLGQVITLRPQFIVANFTSLGIYLYANGVWTPLPHPGVATKVAVDALGDVIAAFGTGGVSLYSGGVWTKLANAAASDVDIAGNGIIVANFPEAGISGVYRNETGTVAGWVRLGTASATSVAVDAAGVIVAAYSNGVFLINPNGSVLKIANANAKQVAIAGNNIVAAQFTTPGVAGLYEYEGGAWTPLSTLATNSLGVDSNGDVAAAFSGGTVVLYQGFVGTKIANATANLIGITEVPSVGPEVVANFPEPGLGLYVTPFTNPKIASASNPISSLGIGE
jgi:hypothetical protein